MARFRTYYKPRSLRRAESKSRRNLVLAIIVSIVFFYLLVTWGLPLLIGGLSVFNQTKSIAQKKSIAEDVSLAPPVLNIPFEATNSSTLKITGYSIPSAKVQIYLDENQVSEIPIKEDGSFETDLIELNFGTNNIYGKTLDDKNKNSLPSKTIKLIYSNEKPKLEIIEPADNKEIKGGDKKVIISGTTDPENSVSINGSTVILNSEGKFLKEQPINDGENQITIKATNDFGNTKEIIRKVIFIP